MWVPRLKQAWNEWWMSSRELLVSALLLHTNWLAAQAWTLQFAHDYWADSRMGKVGIGQDCTNCFIKNGLCNRLKTLLFLPIVCVAFHSWKIYSQNQLRWRGAELVQNWSTTVTSNVVLPVLTTTSLSTVVYLYIYL